MECLAVESLLRKAEDMEIAEFVSQQNAMISKKFVFF